MYRALDLMGRGFVFEGDFDYVLIRKLIGFDAESVNIDVP